MITITKNIYFLHLHQQLLEVQFRNIWSTNVRSFNHHSGSLYSDFTPGKGCNFAPKNLKILLTTSLKTKGCGTVIQVYLSLRLKAPQILFGKLLYTLFEGDAPINWNDIMHLFDIENFSVLCSEVSNYYSSCSPPPPSHMIKI